MIKYLGPNALSALVRSVLTKINDLSIVVNNTFDEVYGNIEQIDSGGLTIIYDQTNELIEFKKGGE